MTMADTIEPSDATEPRSWGNIAVSFAFYISQLAEHRRGDVAELRRMDPEAPDKNTFWRLMAQYDMLGSPEVERKWALILHGIALMTPTNAGGGSTRTAHNATMPVGRALFLGSDDGRENALYSEARFNRLLTSRQSMLRTLLARMFRMLGAAGVSFNWGEMAQFILNDGYDEDAAEDNRRRFARAYYQADRRRAPASRDN